MASTHAFALAFRGGAEITRFDGYRVGLSMLKAGNPWSFALWKSSDARAWRELTGGKFGADVTLSIDGLPQLQGALEDGEIAVDRTKGVQIILSGRDVAATAIDWDADPRVALRDVPFETALSELLNRVGVPLKPITGAAARAVAQGRDRRPAAARRRQRVDQAHARRGERVWQLVQSMARRLGYLVWVAPDPDFGMTAVVDVPAYDSPPVFRFRRFYGPDGTTTADSNVLESHFRRSIKDVPTHLYAHARAARGDQPGQRIQHVATNAELARWPEVRNPLPPHPRWLDARRCRTPAAAAQETRRQISEGMAHWREYTCVVQGHGQTVDGATRLYSLNTMAHVKDHESGLDEDMLITDVEFRGSRGEGQTTALTLGTRGAIVVLPEAS